MQGDSVKEEYGTGQVDPAVQTPPSEVVSSNKNSKPPKDAADGNRSSQIQNPVDLVTQPPPNQVTMTIQSPQQVQHGAFNLASMGNTLPTVSYHPQQSSQHVHAPSQPYNPTISSPMTHQVPPMPTFGAPPMHMANHPYYIQQPQAPQYYPAGHMAHAHNQHAIRGRQPAVYYTNQLIMNPTQPGFYCPQDSQFPNHSPAIPANVMAGAYMTGAPQVDTLNGSSTKQSTVRGPPRKPRQSGHALWIGNLPPQADLIALVQHICKETSGLESLFLISKSNCAFANYKDESTCLAAQQKLHDSKFQAVRLVSRLRKSTVEGSSGTTAPTGPAVGTASPENQPKTDDGAMIETSGRKVADDGQTTGSSPELKRDTQPRHHTDRFFILKSLTTEDLELSVKTSIWATQSHNEAILNDAFQASKNADNVYLMFSANKSGEYFGYARMISEINQDPAAAIEFAPKTTLAAEVNLPKAIPTEASEYIPKGRIIDDSARGTIFWEAEHDDSEAGSDIESETTSDRSHTTDEESKIWGKPFKLEWLSTIRLPFYRTRGLRNPWNSNREVKIARDGTELEPSVGRRLIGMFNRVENSAVAAASQAPMNFAPVYPPGRPYE
ncbi:hypothetical protein QQS21_008914 [Conoideocrella luteorostrata]|uniref:YTH domain-containing protein n=1 Tax=Conoideocrella luteorostrata TaxID=1105319 RepID=A0AAJ0FW43_9HYPO|nr:hypothetical protein QQS21_008914 [Conoideocrella luteorostrata]